MKMKQFTITPYQNFVDDEELNKNLAGATHVETYSIDEKRFGGYKTVVVYAFYPDEDSRPVQAGVMQPEPVNLVKIDWGNELEDDIKKFLEDKEYYNNIGKSIMLPDDAEEFAERLTILIRQQIIKWKNARRRSA